MALYLGSNKVAGSGSEIIESGSNENGNYIKFSDGTAICMKNGNIETSITYQVSTSMKRSGGLQIGNLPIELTKVDYFNSSGNMVYTDNPYMGWINMNDVATTTKFAPIVVYSPTESNNRTINYSAIVVGKWK